MKPLRNLSGSQLVKALEQPGYQPTRQTGRHARLSCLLLPNPTNEPQAGNGFCRVHSMHHGAWNAPYGEVHGTRFGRKNWRLRSLPQAGEEANESLREFQVNEHHFAVLLHDPLKIGAFAAILPGVAAHHRLPGDVLITRLSGR